MCTMLTAFVAVAAGTTLQRTRSFWKAGMCYEAKQERSLNFGNEAKGSERTNQTH